MNLARLKGNESTVSRDLTIIIPSYCCGKYLPMAVSSALHTPAPSILIADDGSRPSDLNIAREMERHNPDRVRVLTSSNNRGVARNINEAIAHVETPFFAKIDGDDVLLPGYIETVFPLIAARPRLAVLAGRELRIGPDEVMSFQPELLPNARSQAPLAIMRGAEAYRFIIQWNPNPTSSGVVYRTAAFRDVGGYDTNINWGEDWEIWLRFARNWEVGYYDAPAALYRIHDESATATATRNHALCYGYDAVYRRAAELCDDPDVLPVIRHKMFCVVKLYIAAAVHQFRRSRHGAIDCWRRAGRALALAVGGSTALIKP